MNAKTNTKEFLEEFKAFAMKGNIVDLAVAVVIGGAFGKIVSSLVDTVVMPTLGLILGGINFTNWRLTFGQSVIEYGKLVQSVVDFLVIAFVVFMALRTLHRFEQKKEEEKPESKSSEEVLLLREIRDAVKR